MASPFAFGVTNRKLNCVLLAHIEPRTEYICTKSLTSAATCLSLLQKNVFNIVFELMTLGSKRAARTVKIESPSPSPISSLLLVPQSASVHVFVSVSHGCGCLQLLACGIGICVSVWALEWCGMSVLCLQESGCLLDLN